jgi:hypothetical protein
MFPFFLPGDELTVSPVHHAVPRKGDVLVFRSGNKLLAHRLASVLRRNEESYYLCRGDNCLMMDAPVPSGQVLGIITERKRGAGLKDCRDASLRIPGRVILFLHPLSYYLIRLVFRIYQLSPRGRGKGRCGRQGA